MRDLVEDLEAGRDPHAAARAVQQRPLPRRFYTQVSVEPREGGHAILLDGKPVLTPARLPLLLPNERLAQAVAAEWEAQREVINPFRMPLTRLVNVALDGVAKDPEASAAEMLNYVGTDLICYRAEGPARLVARQAELWDPILDWLRASHQARFILSEGVMHVAQPPESIARIDSLIPRDPLRLAALVSLTSLMGSALLALAVLHGRLSPAQAWETAHVDEDWNREQWGEDELATAQREARGEDMRAAAALLAALDDAAHSG